MSASAPSGARSAHHFKLVLLGNSGVGKSSLVLRFVKNEFIDDMETTIGAAFLTKTLALEDCSVKLEIWDTAGQERYRSLAPMYYRGAQAAIVVFNVTSQGSFEGAKSWVKELQRKAPPELVIAIVGNKCDLTDRKVNPEEAREFAASIKNSLTNAEAFYMETSAKNNVCVADVFQEVAKRVPKRAQEAKGKDVVQLSPDAAVGGGEGGKSGCAC